MVECIVKAYLIRCILTNKIFLCLTFSNSLKDFETGIIIGFVMYRFVIKEIFFDIETVFRSIALFKTPAVVV